METILLETCLWLGFLLELFLVVYLSPNFLSCLLLVKEILNAAVWSTLCHLVIVMGIVRDTLFLLGTFFVLLGILVWRDIVFLLETFVSFLLGIEPDAFVHLGFCLLDSVSLLGICFFLFLVPDLSVDHVTRLHEHRDMYCLWYTYHL